MTIPKSTSHIHPATEQSPIRVEDVGAVVARATELHPYTSSAASDSASRPGPGELEPGFVADRPTASVIRPIHEAMAVLMGTSPCHNAISAVPGDTASSGETPPPEESLWQFTEDVSEIAVRPGVPTLVIEAAAAQDLVWRSSAQDFAAPWKGNN